MNKSPTKVGLLVSGNGYLAEAILDARDQKIIPPFDASLLTSRPSRIENLATEKSVDLLKVHKKAEESSEDYRNRLSKVLLASDFQRIFLTFDWLLPPLVVDRFRGNSINLHMGLLPSFKGRHAINNMFEQRIANPGVTLHQVTEGMDDGSIIARSCLHNIEYINPRSLGRSLFKIAVPLSLQIIRWWLTESLDLAALGKNLPCVSFHTREQLSDLQNFDQDIIEFSEIYCSKLFAILPEPGSQS